MSTDENNKFMIPSIKKLLYATDLSPNSPCVFRHAMNSAMKHDAEIIILHVFEELSPANRAALAVYLDEKQRKKIVKDRMASSLKRIRKRLKQFCEKELQGNPEQMKRIKTIEVCMGFPADEILRKADEFDCDTIVLGNHGKGVIENTFLGSTAKRVLRRTRKPVYIIPLSGEETEAGDSES